MIGASPTALAPLILFVKFPPAILSDELTPDSNQRWCLLKSQFKLM